MALLQTNYIVIMDSGTASEIECRSCPINLLARVTFRQFERGCARRW